MSEDVKLINLDDDDQYKITVVINYKALTTLYGNNKAYTMYQPMKTHIECILQDFTEDLVYEDGIYPFILGKEFNIAIENAHIISQKISETNEDRKYPIPIACIVVEYVTPHNLLSGTVSYKSLDYSDIYDEIPVFCTDKIYSKSENIELTYSTIFTINTFGPGYILLCKDENSTHNISGNIRNYTGPMYLLILYTKNATINDNKSLYHISYDKYTVMIWDSIVSCFDFAIRTCVSMKCKILLLVDRNIVIYRDNNFMSNTDTRITKMINSNIGVMNHGDIMMTTEFWGKIKDCVQLNDSIEYIKDIRNNQYIKIHQNLITGNTLITDDEDTLAILTQLQPTILVEENTEI